MPPGLRDIGTGWLFGRGAHDHQVADGSLISGSAVGAVVAMLTVDPDTCCIVGKGKHCSWAPRAGITRKRTVPGADYLDCLSDVQRIREKEEPLRDHLTSFSAGIVDECGELGTSAQSRNCGVERWQIVCGVGKRNVCIDL